MKTNAIDTLTAQAMALRDLNLRLEPEMLKYLAARLKAGEPLAAVSLMGVDARTGIAVSTPRAVRAHAALPLEHA